MLREKNIFISHSHRDDDELPKLKALLEKCGYKIKDSSINSSNPNNANNPDYIKQLIRPKIKWAGAMIVLIGTDTHSREWVDWEIQNAVSQGKRVVGIYSRGAKDSDLPDGFDLLGDALVGWNSDKIIDAIEGEDIWLTPDGYERELVWLDIKRSVC